MDNPEKAWQELNEQRRREYNHPEGSACPVCNGSGHVMKIWSDSEYQFSIVGPFALVCFFGAAVMWFSGIR